MFCRNCGTEFSESNPVCPACGMPRDGGEHFCARCGSAIFAGDAFCVNCGAPQSAQASPRAGQYRAAPPLRKSKLAAVLLAFFLGGFGIHNFYLGYTEKGLWQLVLGVLCCGTVSWIWAVVDAIMILCGTIYTDASGMPLGD